MSDMDDLYQEVLLEHAKSKRRKFKPAGSCSCVQGFNPLCGDEVSFYVVLKDGVVSEASFEGQGCAISQASASMAAQQSTGLDVKEARRQLGLALSWVVTGAGDRAALDDWEALGGVSRFPMRVKCATMPIRAALAALGLPAGDTLELGDAP